MHLHIAGICGTFMGGVAILARELGYQVTGSDANVYPPMSVQLENRDIRLFEGYSADHLQPEPDLVIIGNALSRGNPLVEAVLNRGIPYISGPQWIADNLLKDRWVLAVSGTHGKTSTSSMLAWILEEAGLSPGFLIGGVPRNFGVSARLGDDPFFVIEADEYDTAFFDKRSKFVHYRPRTLVINNLEYDHADIFPDLAAIQRQFHHLVRTVPGNGMIVTPAGEPAVDTVLEMGCWTPVETCSLENEAIWQATPLEADGSHFLVRHRHEACCEIKWNLMGAHNMQNALAAIVAARHAGVPPTLAAEALGGFKSVKRRMEVRAEIGGITLYDDFAHHPTAIATTLQGLKANGNSNTRILAILEPRSNTMKLGVHKEQLAPALAAADRTFIYRPGTLEWNLEDVAAQMEGKAEIHADIDQLVKSVVRQLQPGDRIIIMSNGAFGNIHSRLEKVLKNRVTT